MRVIVTRSPLALEKNYDVKLWTLAYGLPYWAADYLRQRTQNVIVSQAAGQTIKNMWRNCWIGQRSHREYSASDYLKRIQKEIPKAAKELGVFHIPMTQNLPDAFRVGSQDFSYISSEIVLENVTRLVKGLSGRRLREKEVVAIERKRGERWKLPLLQILEYACWLGLVRRTPGVVYQGHDRWRCTRCEETHDIVLLPDRCSVCGWIGCPVCRACGGLGVIRGCEPVYEFVRNSCDFVALSKPILQVKSTGLSSFEVSRDRGIVRKSIEPSLSFPLADSQSRASEKLVKFLASNRRVCLLWAVCGAGKTETVFAAMGKVLSSGHRVLFAIPRRDVVLELAPRLKKAFPECKVSVLVGGQGYMDELGDIVVATTHQALRLGSSFGLVVLDEADAFPYASNPVLVRAVQKCVASDGKQIIMTATPDPLHLAHVRKGIWDLVVIPVRHHGHLLPVPQPLIHRSWRLRRLSNVNLMFPCGNGGSYANEMASACNQFPLLIFVPTVAHGRFLYQYLQDHWRGIRTEFVYAAHSHRSRLVNAFRCGQLEVLVCTSILSRGITIPKVNVWVAWADVEQVLDAASLVQMAGRVGRTKDFPHGEVWFLAGRKTKSMQQAVDIIQQANAWAKGNALPDEAMGSPEV